MRGTPVGLRTRARARVCRGQVDFNKVNFFKVDGVAFVKADTLKEVSLTGAGAQN